MAASVLDNRTNAVLPIGGTYGLRRSSFGQPVQTLRADVALGSPIPPRRAPISNRPPANFVAVRVGNNTDAYYQSPDGGAFWVPSTKQVVAAQPNNIVIGWRMTSAVTNSQVFNVSAIPAKRPGAPLLDRASLRRAAG